MAALSDVAKGSESGLLHATASIIAMGSAFGIAEAHAVPADKPAAESAAPAESQDEIVVVASPEERGSIDRTTYIVKDNAEARASSALDLLGRVPSVDVSPSGQVRLIGRGGVTIMIDGQEVAGTDAFLRSLPGSQIAKIELITNPSAQFPARGRGGIINIVTRRNAAAGLGGSVTASVGSFGAYEAKASPSWRRGKVSLRGSVGLGRRLSRLRLRDEWDVPETGPVADRIEDGHSRSRTDSLAADLLATVELAPKQTLSIQGRATNFDGRTSSEAEISEGGEQSRRRSSGETDIDGRHIAADYRREGGKAGAETSVSATRTWFRTASDQLHRTEAGPVDLATFRVRSDQSGRSTILKADHLLPAGERRLSAGGRFEHSFEDNRQSAVTDSPSGEPVAMETALSGSWSEAAAYLTYQFPLWGSTVMAGSRVESRWYDIRGADEDPTGGTHLFPSLHVERKLNKWLIANLSYSSRVDWRSIAELDPRPRFSDPTSATAGNPLLRPGRTHSVELKLTAKAQRHSADLTAYYQRTRDLRSYATELEGEVLVSRPVNVGTRISRGANLQLRGPLARGLNYVASAYVARETIGETGLPGIDGSSTSYGGSVQLEYRDGIEGRAGADHVRLSANYAGPTETGLARDSSHARASASWSHGLTHRLSAVMTASHWLSSPTSTVFGGDVISRQKSRFPGPIVNFALTYSLSPSAP